MFSTVTKMMLKNVIKHTDTHNKIVEECDMWKQHEQKKERERDPRQSFLYDDRFDTSRDYVHRGSRHAHMDDRDDDEKKQSTFWQRQLQKAEEADPDRWGHSGFKELYPDKFRSDRSEDSDDSVEGTKKRKKKNEKKRKNKDGNGRKKSYKRSRSTSESYDSESDSGKRYYKPHYKQVSSKSNHYRHADRSHSSISSSDSESNSRKRKYKFVIKTEPKDVESDTLLHKRKKSEVEDFQWIEKPRNVNCKDLHSRVKSEKDLVKNDMREPYIKSDYKNTIDKCYSDRRNSQEVERKNQDQYGHDKISLKKKKHKSHKDVSESSRKKIRTSSVDFSEDSHGSVHNSRDGGVDKTQKKKHKTHKNKQKSKKKKQKHSLPVSDESSGSDSETHYRKR